MLAPVNMLPKHIGMQKFKIQFIFIHSLNLEIQQKQSKSLMHNLIQMCTITSQSAAQAHMYKMLTTNQYYSLISYALTQTSVWLHFDAIQQTVPIITVNTLSISARSTPDFDPVFNFISQFQAISKSDTVAHFAKGSHLYVKNTGRYQPISFIFRTVYGCLFSVLKWTSHQNRTYN